MAVININSSPYTFSHQGKRMLRNEEKHKKQLNMARNLMSRAEGIEYVYGKGKGHGFAVESYEKAIDELESIPVDERTSLHNQLLLQALWDVIYAAESYIDQCEGQSFSKSYQESLKLTQVKLPLFAKKIVDYLPGVPVDSDVDACLMLACGYIIQAGEDAAAPSFVHFMTEARATLAGNFNHGAGQHPDVQLTEKQLRRLTWCLCSIARKCLALGDREVAIDLFSRAVDFYSHADLSQGCDYGIYFPAVNSELAKAIGQKLLTLYARTSIYAYNSSTRYHIARKSLEEECSAMLHHAAMGPPGYDANRVIFICAAIDLMKTKPAASWTQDEIKKIMKAYDTVIYYLLDLSSTVNIFPVALSEKRSYFQQAEAVTQEAIVFYHQRSDLDDIDFQLDAAKSMLRFHHRNVRFQEGPDEGRNLDITIQEMMFSGSHYKEISGGRFTRALFHENFAKHYLPVVYMIKEMLARPSTERPFTDIQNRNLAYVYHLLGSGFAAIGDTQSAFNYYQQEIDLFSQLASCHHNDCEIVSRAYRAMEEMAGVNTSIKGLYTIAKKIFDASCLIAKVSFEDLLSVDEAFQQEFTSGNMTNCAAYLAFLSLLKSVLDKMADNHRFLLTSHQFRKQMSNPLYVKKLSALYERIEAYRWRHSDEQLDQVVPTSREGLFGKRNREAEVLEMPAVVKRAGYDGRTSP